MKKITLRNICILHFAFCNFEMSDNDRGFWFECLDGSRRCYDLDYILFIVVDESAKVFTIRCIDGIDDHVFYEDENGYQWGDLAEDIPIARVNKPWNQLIGS